MVFSGLVGKSNYFKNIRSSKAEREHLVKFLLFINRFTEKVFPLHGVLFRLHPWYNLPFFHSSVYSL